MAQLRPALTGSAEPIAPEVLNLLPYRPDLLRTLGPAALGHPELRARLLGHPACALSLLTACYEQTAATLEPTLAGAGEQVYHLLDWAGRTGQTLRQPEGFYRQTLLQDSYWGVLHARRTGDRTLLAEVRDWSNDERHRYAGAAAYFLIQHPREPVAPYRELLLANPFYAYCALPCLHPRGFRVEARNVTEPKWAFHFAGSDYATRPEKFLPCLAEDPGWAVELTTAWGWLRDPIRLGECRDLAASRSSHPLHQPALRFLDAAARLRARSAPVADPGSLPLTGKPWLRSGLIAEARALDSLNIPKNTDVWRPSLAQIDSPAFRQIVGTPQFTPNGRVRGTVLDSVDPDLAEIKWGSSILHSTYQLRLQTYRAVAEARTFRIYTNRPVNLEFGHWLHPWGVQIEPLPGILE